MSNEIIHSTGKLTDRQVVRLMEAISKKFKHRDIKYQCGTIYIEDEDIKTLTHGKSSMVTAAHFAEVNNKFIVYFRRGTSAVDSNGNVNFNSRIPSPYFDEIIIQLSTANNPPNSAVTSSDCKELNLIISKLVTVKLPDIAGASAGSAIDLLQKQLSSLSDLYEKMVEDSSIEKSKLQRDYDQKQKQLAERTKAERKAIEEDEKRSKEKIAKLSDDLEKTRAELDDRDHMHVRRDLREKISNDIKDRVSKSLVPAEAVSIGNRITVLTWICAAFFAVLAFLSFLALSAAFANVNSATLSLLTQIWLIGRTVVTSAASVGFALYALSWMRKTYLDNVKTTNDLQRYAMDINRASWTIETILETTKEGSALPDKWVEGVCHGLFQTSEQQKSEVTPLDAWGALLNVTGKAEIGPDGPKLSFNRQQSKKLAKGSDTE